MAVEIRQFACLIPAGTAQSSPVTVDCSFPARIVESIRVNIPSGPNGVMGFMILAGGGQIIPANPGVFIVANDDHYDWTLQNMPTSGSWQLSGYNTGIYDHTVYLQFALDLVQSPAPAAPAAPLEVATLVSTAPADQGIDLTAPTIPGV